MRNATTHELTRRGGFDNKESQIAVRVQFTTESLPQTENTRLTV